MLLCSKTPIYVGVGLNMLCIPAVALLYGCYAYLGVEKLGAYAAAAGISQHIMFPLSICAAVITAVVLAAIVFRGLLHVLIPKFSYQTQKLYPQYIALLFCFLFGFFAVLTTATPTFLMLHQALGLPIVPCCIIVGLVGITTFLINTSFAYTAHPYPYTINTESCPIDPNSGAKTPPRSLGWLRKLSGFAVLLLVCTVTLINGWYATPVLNAIFCAPALTYTVVAMGTLGTFYFLGKCCYDLIKEDKTRNPRLTFSYCSNVVNAIGQGFMTGFALYLMHAPPAWIIVATLASVAKSVLCTSDNSLWKCEFPAIVVASKALLPGCAVTTVNSTDLTPLDSQIRSLRTSSSLSF